MTKFKSLVRSVAVASASVLAFGLLLVPQASAAFLSIDVQATDKEFNIANEDKIEFKVTMNQYDQDAGVGFSIRGPLGENNEQLKLLTVHQYTGNDTFTFSWDGTINGVDAVPGKYRAEFSNINLNPNPLTYEFEVVDNAPELSFDQNPQDQYTLGNPAQEIKVALDGYISPTKVQVWALGPKSDPNAIQILIGEHTYQGNSMHTFKFEGENIDGEALAPGEYEMSVSGTYGDNDKTKNELEYVLEVLPAAQVPATPTLSVVGNTPSTYTLGSGNYDVDVELKNFKSNVDVEMKLEGPDGAQNKVTFTADEVTYDANETNEFSWDGKVNGQNVAPGDYKVTIEGEGTNTVEYELTVKAAPVVQEENCEGFKDLKADYKYCDAIKKVVEAGLMFGQDDGTGNFDLGEINRAESVAVYARLDEAYDEDDVDCKANPFPDVNCTAWYGPLVKYSLDEGYVTGYKAPDPRAGKFVPTGTTTQPESLVVLARILDITPPNTNSSYGGKVAGGLWYSGAYVWSEQIDLIEPNEVDVRSNFTREDMARALAELIDQGVIK